MSDRKYRRNHYVPQWYQARFFQPGQDENKFYYLDLHPEQFRDARGVKRTKTSLHRWGTPRCFCEDDLYTIKFGGWESTEIEQKLFGQIDNNGRHAVQYFTGFAHPSVNGEAFHSLLRYMSIQKLRTPKGLDWMSNVTQIKNKNAILSLMQRVQRRHCAVWSECVWQIADASASSTKFIISDHPVTVYNRGCFPFSPDCRGCNDPDIRFHGTHTVFPLDLNKILILTNLSWLRNPYQNPTKMRPNPELYRPAMFDFTDIQTLRHLTEMEVREINFIIKKRAFRYVAAANEEWLYPEAHIPTTHWSKLGGGLLLMPDPRSATFGRTLVIGYDNDRSEAYDEYGRKPWQEGYEDEELAGREWETFHRFQGEFARRFGPQRRGRSFMAMQLDPQRDHDDYHQYHLSLEKKKRLRRSNRGRMNNTSG